MAADSGQPQNTQKVKKPVTPEQRKLYAQLGVIGFLTLIVAVMYLPSLFSGGSKPNLPVAPTAGNTITTEAPSTGTTPAPGDKGTAKPADTTTTATTTTTTTAPAVAPGLPAVPHRADPFQEVYFIPTPTPIPPPIPPPVSLPSPHASAPIALPGQPSLAESQSPLNLPPVRITRLDETARHPTDAFPPRRTTGAGSSNTTPSPSYDKRLSGVVIGDGIRALLEIQHADGVVTRVVQPGDEVDGITVLNIQRYNDGTRTVTRMLIRENGEERIVELKAGQQQAAAPGAAP